MEMARWTHLQKPGDKLNPDEVAQGWHYCPDWDELLIGPEDPEMDGCTCRI